MKFPFISLSKIRDDFCYYENNNTNYKYKSAFIEIKKKNNKIFIKTDYFSQIPFYYYKGDGELYGNTSFVNLLKELKLKNVKLTLNKIAVIGFLKNNSFLENDTYFNEISKIPPSSELIYDQNTGKVIINEYYKFVPNYHADDKISKNDLIEKYYKIQKKIFDNYLEDKKKNNEYKIGLSLTGGFDSRIILGGLKDIKNLDLVAFHYGNKLSPDYIYSKKLINELNLSHNINTWKDLKFLKKNNENFFLDTDYMLPIHHGHLYESVKSQKNIVDTIFYGHFMDMHMQSHFYNRRFDNNVNKKQVEKFIFNMWCGAPSAFSVLNINILQKLFPKNLINAYFARIDQMISRFAYLDSDKQYEIHYLINHGLRRAISQCQLGSKYLDYKTPSLDFDLFNFVWSLRTKVKKNRLFQSQIFLKKFEYLTKINFVLDNYKIINLNSKFYDKILKSFENFLRHPKINFLKPYYDFWGREYENFDSFKSWMKNETEINLVLFNKFMGTNDINNVLKNNYKDLPLSFVSSLFTVSKFFKFCDQENLAVLD